MSDDLGRRRRTRRLTSEEHTLWRGVTEQVKPLRARKRVLTSPPVVEETPAPPPPRAAPAKPTPVSRKQAPRAPVPAPPAPPALAPLNRREKQRVARGSVALDARLDLHGMTQDRAHAALLRFLRGAQAEGAKIVLVITGKGARALDGGSERGVLRRLVPQWLALPEFRACIVGFETAAIMHGGEGALYLRVRRGRG